MDRTDIRSQYTDHAQAMNFSGKMLDILAGTLMALIPVLSVTSEW